MPEYSMRFLRFTKGMLARMLADAILLTLALAAAVSLRLIFVIAFQDPQDVSETLRRDLLGFLTAAWAVALISLIVFHLNGFYTYGKNYQGRYKAFVIARAVSISYVLFAFLCYFISHGDLPIARGALVLAWLFTIAALCGARVWNVISKQIVDPERERLSRRGRKERRTLVIGGAGYIGSALVPLLLDAGHKVRVLDLLLFGEKPLAGVAEHPNLEVVKGDFRNSVTVFTAMRNVDQVVHLGAIVGDPACALDETLTIDINLVATRRVAEQAKELGIQRFVFASTCSVYGACDEMIDERSEVKPVSLYGHTKLASERVLTELAEANFQPTVLRFATIYGFSGRTRFDLVVNVMTARAKIDGEITVFGGDQWRPFVHVEDAAEAVKMALEAPQEVVGYQTFNVGSNEQNYTIIEIANLVQEQVVGSKLVVESDSTDPRNYRVGFHKIENQLGFRPKWTIVKGIHQVIEAIAEGDITDYREAAYSNARFLSEGGTSHLAGDRWAHDMIRTLTDK